MKLKILLHALLITLLFPSVSSAQKKVMGYFPYYRTAADIPQIDFNNLTDVVFAFMLGNTTTGGIKYPNNSSVLFKALADAADLKGVGVWISVGGGGWITGDMVTAIKLDRPKFISEIVDFCSGNNASNLVLKGVDIDWEFPKTTIDKDLHETLICELRTAFDNQQILDGHRYEVSIAVGGDVKSPTNHLSYINSATFACADEVVIMSYDGPGSFYNNHHSSLQMAQDNITAWANQGCPKSKMVLALPFYGSNASQTNSDTYENLDGYFPGIDLLAKDDHLGWYYNGRQTLQDKVELICSETGKGVTIWELTQDVDLGGTETLLEIVYNKMMNTTCNEPNSVNGMFVLENISAFPNPTKNTVELSGLSNRNTQISIYDVSGKKLNEYSLNSTNNKIDLTNYSNGLYILKLNNNHNVVNLKINKK